MHRRFRPLAVAVFGITFAALPGGFNLAADQHPSPPPPKQDDHAKPAPAANPAVPHFEHAAPASGTKKTEPLSKHAPAKVTPAAQPALSEPIDADAALELLREGNSRWVAGTCADPNIDSARRAALAEHGQHPFVTVLTCADSRLPVERLFDRGVGDVFVVRVAGAVAGDSEVGTIEYGVEHLKTPLLVVMGHTQCGAVAAAASGAEVHGKVAELVAVIAPAVERARRNHPHAEDSELMAHAIRENVWQTIFDLYKTSPVCREMVQNSELRVVGAVCDIASGKVEWLGEHPWQAELMDALDARESHEAVVEAEPTEHGH